MMRLLVEIKRVFYPVAHDRRGMILRVGDRVRLADADRSLIDLNEPDGVFVVARVERGSQIAAKNWIGSIYSWHVERLPINPISPRGA